MMKRFFFTVFCLALLVVKTNAEVVDVKVAVDIASQFLGNTTSSLQPSSRLLLPAADDIGKTPAYYLFVNDEKSGFVIVAADNAVQPILAYSDNTRLDDIPDAMQAWLDDMELQIEKVREMQLQPSEEVKQMWQVARVGSPVVLLETAKWDQEAPYNNECPVKDGQPTYTGCVCTAYAILMKYYGYPASAQGTTPAYFSNSYSIEVEARDLNHTYNWDKMPAIGVFADEEEEKEVARLMADIGAAIQADYGPYGTEGTGAQYGKAAITQFFNYCIGEGAVRSNYTESEWNSRLQGELNLQRPILYQGNNGKSGGHAFILDGYTDDNYYHVNWGWGGNYDGYFLLNALTPGDSYLSKNQMAILGCMPLELFEGEAVAQVGETMCPDMKTAFTLSDLTGEKVVILKDCLLDSYETNEIEERLNVVVDLNGKRIDLNDAFWVYGSLSIEDSKGNGVINTASNGSVINNYGKLTISGGAYQNTCKTVGFKDYRRVIYNDEKASMNVSGGKFEILDGLQCLCLLGKTTISGGEFIQRDNSELITNFGDLTISAGTFQNTCDSVSGNDYRRVMWCDEGSTTYISDGHFEILDGAQCLCFIGKATITGGEFIDRGNCAVVGSFCKTDSMLITGGHFLNTCEGVNDEDYRRVFEALEETYTLITGGTFEALHSNAIGLLGNADIRNAIISAPEDYAVRMDGDADTKLTIQDCFVNGGIADLYAKDGTIEVLTGYFAHAVNAKFLAEGSTCQSNTDVNTNETYKYVVMNQNNPNAIEAVPAPELPATIYKIYSPTGVELPQMRRGLNMIVDERNHVKKVILK